jgi:hypothetical protein
MQIVVTVFLDQTGDLLAKGPELVSLYELKDAHFLPSLKSWLAEAEEVLAKYHRPQVGELAGLRAQLLAAADGVYDKNSFYIPAIKETRKTYRAFAAIIFNNAQRILSNLHITYSAHREEAEKFLRQIVLISLQKNTFYPIWNSSTGTSEKLSRLWQSFSTDVDLVQGTRQILSNVNYIDALRVLSDIILDWKL